MNKKISETRKSIKYSYLNGATDAIIKALTTGPLLTTYAVGIGLNNLNIGLLQSILPFSNLIHLYVARLLEKGISPRKIAYTCATISSFFLLLIAFAIFFKESPRGILFFIIPYICAHICNSFTGGAFWPWCKEFVPKKITTAYFAYKAQIIQAAKLTTFLAATGIIYLIHTHKPDSELYCYSLFYGIAFLTGLLNAWAFFKIKDVTIKREKQKSYLEKVQIAFKNNAFIILLLGIGLANFISTFYTSFNIVFLLKSMKLTAFVVICFTLLTNLVEISVAQLWKKYANKRTPTILVSTSAIIYALSTLCFISQTFAQITNPIFLTLLLIFTATILGISSSGFFIGTNAICVTFVPNKMSPIYLSLLNIGRFCAAGLGASCGGILLQSLSQNNYKWTIFFSICAILYIITSIFIKKVKQVKHLA